ncbi:glycoside hydrolase family 57 protein [Phycisphaeraceae bacterium D3-23]
MPAVCLYFQLHQPRRLRRFRVFEAGHDYYDDEANAQILRRVAGKCYLPTTALLLDQITANRGKFRVAFSLTGQVIEQLQRWSPEVIERFVALAQTGCVEFLAETYNHSLSSCYSPGSFEDEVDRHDTLIEDLFGQRPAVFRNTELVYSDAIAKQVAAMGRYRAVLAEGVDRLLDGRTPNTPYRPAEPSAARSLALLLKNHRLSDDLAFRFGEQSWEHHPLTAATYAQWLTDQPGEAVNLFMDFETFGEHKWVNTGIFDLLKALPSEVLGRGGRFVTPGEAADLFVPKDTYAAPDVTSWADTERDLSAWNGNTMQSSAIKALYDLEQPVLNTRDAELLADWQSLGTSDHFYYMSTKHQDDGAVHAYFNPYDSPYDAYLNYMNVLENLKQRVARV